MWRKSLEDAGAVIGDDGVEHFVAPDTEGQFAMDGDIVADLSQFGIIAAAGSDAGTFLQGQLINDVNAVTDQHSQLSGACSPKGRLLASFRIMLREQVYYLLLARELLDSTIKRLGLYVLRANVQLRDASEELVRLGFKGPAAAAAAKDLLGELPAEVDDAQQSGQLTVVRLHGEQPRYLVLGPVEASMELWQALTPVARPVGTPAWSLTDIMAGVPIISSKTADAFIPQMINYDAIGGVSFTKGCYTGQEIVARTQYLGKLKRRLYRAHLDADTPPAPGDELFAPNFPGGQSVGRLVSIEASPGGGFELLAVIQLESAESDTIHLGTPEGPALRLLPLPYSLETA